MFIIQLLLFLTKHLKNLIGKAKTELFSNLITKGEKFYSLDRIFDFDAQKTVTRLTLLLPGKGCSWARETGGCTMCGFSQKIEQVSKSFTDKDLIAMYKIAELMTMKDQPFLLTIYNGGSFINNKEISLHVQKEICQKINRHPTIKKLFIESRAEFVTAEKMQTLKKTLGGKILTVAVGLEAQDDKVRNVYIRKGLSKKTYEKAIRIIKESGARALTYIFIKPIYLSEKEAIVEAIDTAKYAFKAKTDEIAFESAFIQKGTPMEKLYLEGKFSPPWLWSIIEVIKETHGLGPIHLGGFEDEPPPIAIPSNCNQCSKKIRNLLQVYRETNNIKTLFDTTCKCKEEWQKLTKF